MKTIEQLLCECPDDEVVFVHYDEAGQVTEGPAIKPRGPVEALAKIIGLDFPSTRGTPLRLLVEERDAPPSDDDDAPVSELTVHQMYPRSPGGEA
jgi:hypothetical protein